MATTERIAILGGGMAGLTAAWKLSEAGWKDRFESITVYQRGHRLGGKGASSRGTNGRIEEHGLHIWLGYYDNAFAVLRECYEELNRARYAPECPIRSLEDALKPSVTVGLEDAVGSDWERWIGRFATNGLRPGDDSASAPSLTGADIVQRALRLLGDLSMSIGSPTGQPTEQPIARLSASADPPTTSTSTASRPTTSTSAGALAAMASLALALEAIRTLRSSLDSVGLSPVIPAIDAALGSIESMLARGISSEQAPRHTWQLVSVVLAQVRGIVADGLLDEPRAFSKINNEDYREWILRHGAAPEAADSALIRGMYDLVFGYEGGDPSRPRFAAGLGVFLSAKLFFDYKGAIFWKMQAGMGDVVFAPLYQALRERGVDFQFFSRVDRVHLTDDRQGIGSITVGRQAHLAPGVDHYQPLVEVNGLAVFPQHPLVEQLSNADGIAEHDLESFWSAWPDAASTVLRRGVDFDRVVFAIPVGMARHICQDLIDDRDDWRAMVTGLGTVATQALQLWLNESEPDLGWDATGSTMSGFVEPFDTWASMPQLIEVEDWPPHDQPRAIAYFCNSLQTDDQLDPDDHDYPRRRHDEVRANSATFMDGPLRHQLPGAHDADGFRWNLLCGEGDAAGPDRLDSQFWTANVDPSDLYVQSLPGTDRLRLRPAESGYDNLVLAGDWTNCGLNAGCIEAAVLSGLKAANALLGVDPDDRIRGVYM